MSRTLASTLSLCCLTLLLPCTTPTWAEEHAAAAPAEAAPATTDSPADASAETPAAPPTEHVAVPERSENEAQALEQQLPNVEQQQLAASDGNFLALWKPANAAEASGVVILIPGDSESADWPQAIGPLRNKLPDVGWSSLSLTLPDPHDQAPQVAPAPAPSETANATAETDPAAPATDTAQAAPDATPATTTQASAAPEAGPLTQATPEQHAERVLARIQAAVAFAQTQKPKRIVLLGHGSGGYWAARYLGNSPNPEVQNLLLVAATVPEGFTPPLEELVPGLKLAVGDFYYTDQIADRTTALKRQQASKRQANPAYVQVAMKALPGNPATEQEQLFRRIRGWLSLDVKAPAGK
jgi:pimeloyl-ACP methyl ester carboxylesterase